MVLIGVFLFCQSNFLNVVFAEVQMFATQNPVKYVEQFQSFPHFAGGEKKG